MKKYIEILTNPKLWLIVAAVGIWVIVFQNFGLFGEKSQKVYVTGGDIDARVDDPVRVEVDNTVDVNLSAINGYRNCFYNNYYDHPNKYYRIPVTNN